jgi:hypothetical protein
MSVTDSSSRFTSSSSLLPGVLAHGSSSARSSLSPSARVVLPSPPLPTGSGTASSPLSPLTSSVPTRPTSVPRSSGFGVRSVSAASSTPTSSSTRPRVLPSNRSTSSWRSLLPALHPSGSLTPPLLRRWASPRTSPLSTTKRPRFRTTYRLFV